MNRLNCILSALILGCCFTAYANAECTAKNQITGQLERVPEIWVRGQADFPLMARTRPMPDGSWRIEWNEDRLNLYRVSRVVEEFLFHHECAHARFAAASEAVADCEALRVMRSKGIMTERVFNEISDMYAHFRRPFPSGSCR